MINVEPLFEIEAGGRTGAYLVADGRPVSRLTILPLSIHVGRAIVPVDGIAGVWTEEAHRGRGYARRLIEATVQRLRAGNSPLSLLYGIKDFYSKFGYATVGYDFGIRLHEIDRPYPVPDNWTLRPFASRDLSAIQRLYARATARAVGPVVRPPDSPVWQRLAACADSDRPVWKSSDSTSVPGRDECRVAIAPGGEVEGYLWRGKGLNYVSLDERYFPTDLCIGEAAADNPPAADAVLAACRALALEEVPRLAAAGLAAYHCVRIGAQPEARVAAAAQYHEAWSTGLSWDCGGPMVRVLDVPRLFAAAKPELDERWRGSGLAFRGTLHVRTDIGSAHLFLAEDGIAVKDGTESTDRDVEHVLRVDLPQTALARLALGGFPPDDLLARLGLSEEDPAAQILAVLFPRRYPYMYLADRP